MKRGKNTTKSVDINQFLEFIEYELDPCLYMGQVALNTYEKYEQMAESLSTINPIVKNIPHFSLSLLDKQGSIGLLEKALKDELGM